MKYKLDFLDGLRGLAAFIVVIDHFILRFYPAMLFDKPEFVKAAHFSLEPFIPKTPLNVLYNGNFAVCLFFVLSGYVLSYSYFKTRNKSYIISNSFKRYPRLAIPALFQS